MNPEDTQQIPPDINKSDVKFSAYNLIPGFVHILSPNIKMMRINSLILTHICFLVLKYLHKNVKMSMFPTIFFKNRLLLTSLKSKKNAIVKSYCDNTVFGYDETQFKPWIN